jgi:HK97 family phage prohead protease
MRLSGYPIVFASPYSPARGVEEVVGRRVLEHSLREHANVKCLLNHDAAKQVASLDDGSLRLLVDSLGVRAEVDVDDSTAATRELLAALDAGTIRGGSFGWTMLRNRWHLDRSPVRVEVTDALVHEVSVILAPHRPRYAGTWAGALGPGMAKLYHHLDQQRARCVSRLSAPEPAADLVLTLKPNSYGMWAPLMRLLEDQTAPEWKAVQEASRQHPSAKIIDVRYARTVKSCQEVVHRRSPQPAAAPKTVVASRPAACSRPRSQTPEGTKPMSVEHDEWERRPAPGSAIARPEHFAAARRSFLKFKALHEARQRGGLTIDAAREKSKKSMGAR